MRIENLKPIKLGEYFGPTMARPGIPVEKPRRREIPDIQDPMPRKMPTPVVRPTEPSRTPQLPVPVRR